jgi:hypothetical protein
MSTDGWRQSSDAFWCLTLEPRVSGDLVEQNALASTPLSLGNANYFLVLGLTIPIRHEAVECRLRLERYGSLLSTTQCDIEMV